MNASAGIVDHPEGSGRYPDKVIARLAMMRPTLYVMVADTLAEVQAMVPPGLERSARAMTNPPENFVVTAHQDLPRRKVMPQSKHRRKAGGKSLKHPGRGKPPREWPLSPEMVVWDRFSTAYNRPFHRQWPDDPGGVGEMLDIVSAAVLDMRAVAFRTADKSEILTEFLEPFEEEDGTSVTRTPEQAEAALAFLVEQEMVVVEGELIAIHPRFADVLTPLLANAGQGSVV